MELNNLKYTKGSRNHKTKTYGRGFGSGIGKTSGKGTKGQKSRKSGKVRLGFEGGQTPLYRKIPKVGFNNYNFQENYEIVTLTQVTKLGEEVNKETLVKAGLISSAKAKVKLIGGKKSITLSKPLNITVDKVSANVEKAISAAGGKVNYSK